MFLHDYVLTLFLFLSDSNELRRKLARSEDEHAEKTRQFNEEVASSMPFFTNPVAQEERIRRNFYYEG